MTEKMHEATWRDAPGWDGVESGMDLAFRAITARIVLVLLGGVALIAPDNEGTAILFGVVATILVTLELGVTALLVRALRRASRPPATAASARPLIVAALGTALASLGATALLLVHRLAGVFDSPRAEDALAFIGDLLLLLALALLLAAVARVAAKTPGPSLRRVAVAGQLALVALALAYAVLHLTGRLVDPIDGARWTLALGAFVLPAAVFILYPLHRLARRLRLAADPPGVEEDFDLDAPFPVLELALFRRRRRPPRPSPLAPADGDPDTSPWVPRSERLARLALAGSRVAPPPDQRVWERAREGLRLAFGGVAGRVAVLLCAFVMPPYALGGGPLSHVVALIFTAGLAYCSWALARGLIAACAVPRAHGRPHAHRLRVSAAAVGCLLLAVDLTALALALIALATGATHALATPLVVASGALAVLVASLLALSLDALGRSLREGLLVRRARALLMNLPLLAAALAARELVGHSGASDVRALEFVFTIASFIFTAMVGVTLMHLLHDGAEAVDDHLGRARRDAEAAALPSTSDPG